MCCLCRRYVGIAFSCFKRIKRASVIWRATCNSMAINLKLDSAYHPTHWSLWTQLVCVMQTNHSGFVSLDGKGHVPVPLSGTADCQETSIAAHSDSHLDTAKPAKDQVELKHPFECQPILSICTHHLTLTCLWTLDSCASYLKFIHQ